jgi:O-antigen ligase
MILISMIVFLLDFIIANAFGLGETGYKGSSEDTFFGGGGVNLAKNISVILLMSPIIYQELMAEKNLNRRWLWIFYIALFFGIIFLGLALKRGAILGFALGGLTFLVLSPNKLRNFKNVLVVFFVLLALSPFYWNRVVENLEIRSDAIHLESEENLEKQGRYLEYQFVMDQWENADVFQQIFGANLFNEREHYSINRMFHTDYMSLLSGAGVIGLLVFIFTYFSILRELYVKVIQHPSVVNKRNWAIGAAIIVAVFVNGFSGTITSIEPRGMVMLYLGSLIGYAVPKNKI